MSSSSNLITPKQAALAALFSVLLILWPVRLGIQLWQAFKVYIHN